MTLLTLSPDELLTTTRSVRKRLDFDRPVDLNLVTECIEIALQAPTASNMQHWQFVVVTDQAKKDQLAALYRQAWEIYRTLPLSVYAINRETEQTRVMQDRVTDSAEYLLENIQRAPVMVIPCFYGRLEAMAGMGSVVFASIYGSIMPSVWSFMLAARVRSLASCLTTVHLFFEKEAAQILEIPFEEVTQVGLLPVAHSIGTDFKPAPRRDLASVVHLNSW